MISFGHVRQWRATPLDEVVGELNKRSEELMGMSDELASSAAPSGWSGPAADAAEHALEKLSDQMEELVAEIAAARRAAADTSDTVTVLEHLVKEADGLAHEKGLIITDQGQVVPRAGGSGDGFFDWMSTAVEITDRVDTILRRANDVEEFLSGVFDKLANSQITIGDVDSLMMADQEGEKHGSFHDELLKKYNVSVDPDGMVTYPDGFLGWTLERLGIEPQEMTAGEAELLHDIGLLGTKDAYDIYKTAIHDAENVFDGAGITDGHSDAFRHAYWNAMLANRFGQEWTEQYTTAHERIDTNRATAEAMDLHNNEVGRRIAAEHPDAGPDELKGYIEDAVRNGEMVLVDPDGQLVHSNEVPIGDTGEAQDDPAVGGHDPKIPDGNEHSSGGYNPGSDGENYGTYDN